MDDTQLTKLYSAECAKLQESKTWTGLRSAWDRLETRLDALVWPWDTRFNAVWWAEDVFYVCQEIAFGLSWMKAYRSHYDEVSFDEHRLHCHYHTSYHADNCMTRVMSCRDKLALLAWSYYDKYFDPEKRVPSFEDILKRLKNPSTSGPKISRQKYFIDELQKLKGAHFSRVKTYRDLKVHRFEPRIVIDSATASDRISYLRPLTTNKELRDWEAGLKRQFPNERMRKFVERNCHINGVPFDRRTLKDSSWQYDEVDRRLSACADALFGAAAGSIKILLRRAPLNSRGRSRRKM